MNRFSCCLVYSQLRVGVRLRTFLPSASNKWVGHPRYFSSKDGDSKDNEPDDRKIKVGVRRRNLSPTHRLQAMFESSNTEDQKVNPALSEATHTDETSIKESENFNTNLKGEEDGNGINTNSEKTKQSKQKLNDYFSRRSRKSLSPLQRYGKLLVDNDILEETSDPAERKLVKRQKECDKNFKPSNED